MVYRGISFIVNSGERRRFPAEFLEAWPRVSARGGGAVGVTSDTTLMNLRAAAGQLRALAADLQRVANRRPSRWLTMWTNASAWTSATYRVDRSGYLCLGERWRFVRPLCAPMFTFFRLMGARGDIHYRADVGEGLLILHPDLGVVISGHAVIGRNLVLTGGNCIGWRGGADDEFVIGDHVTLGANAVVLGPVRIGDHVKVGAGAVVLDDAEDETVLVGVPARSTRRATRA